MSYYFEKTLTNVSFDEAIEKVTEELKKEGFGILTEIETCQVLKTWQVWNIQNHKTIDN